MAGAASTAFFSLGPAVYGNFVVVGTGSQLLVYREHARQALLEASPQATKVTRIATPIRLLRSGSHV
jgi:hypothetical protein